MVIDDYSKPLFEYDELQLYFGEDYVISDKIRIHQPTIGEIAKWGEKRYYNMVYTMTCIPSDMKSTLDDIGINYMEISDFELFMLFVRSFSPADTSILFGEELDFTTFEVCSKKIIGEEEETICLYSKKLDIEIDEIIYYKIIDYLRLIHNIIPKKKVAYNERTRQVLIQLDREDKKRNQGKPYRSELKRLISAMMRYPAFKYKKNELKECGLYEFMDLVTGAQIYVSSTALLQGSYSGMVDVSKIDKKEFNWMRDVKD